MLQVISPHVDIWFAFAARQARSPEKWRTRGRPTAAAQLLFERDND
jgi:hypothetical protein